MYSQVLVSYDISNTKNRNKLYQSLKDIGLKPIQKSTFWGYILPSERRVIKVFFKKYCNIENDKAFIVNATLDRLIEDTFGYSKNDFNHPDGFEII